MELLDFLELSEELPDCFPQRLHHFYSQQRCVRIPDSSTPFLKLALFHFLKIIAIVVDARMVSF